MARSAAEMFIQVSADIDAALASLNKVDKAIAGMAGDKKPLSTTEQLKKNFEAARPAGYALAGAGAAVTGALGMAVSTAADFEAQMSAVKSVMSPDDMARYGGALEKLAIQLGADTAFSASEAAGGIEELVKAGVGAEDILAGVGKSALDLAAATGIQVADAASIAAGAMNAFRKSAGEMPAVMDTLAGTANASAADMTDLRLGLQMSSAVAATVGMSFEDLSTAIGLMANSGIRGSDAGTSLKTMMMRLAPQTKEATALMQDLGIITANGSNRFFDATGKFAGLANMAGVLQGALEGLSEEQQMVALTTMFGTDAIRAGSVMAREGATGVSALTTEIAKMSVADMAAVRLDNLKGSTEQLKGSWESASIIAGQFLTPALRGVADMAKNVLNAFIGLPAPVQGFLVVAAALAGVVAALGGAFILLAPGIMALPAAFAAVGSAVGIVGGVLGGLVALLTGPVALAIAAIVAAVAVLYMAWTNDWFGIQEVVGTVWRFLETAFAGIASWVGDNLLPLFRVLADVGIAAVGKASEALGNVWNRYLLPALTELWNLVSGAVGPVLQWLADTVVSPLASAFWNISNAIRSATSWLSDLAGAIGSLQLPEWLQPGSPTPFELGLWGIVSALRGVDAALPATAFGGIGGPVGGGLSGGGAIINGPLIGSITVAGEADEDRLVEKLRLMLEQALDVSLGQSTRQPIGLEGTV